MPIFTQASIEPDYINPRALKGMISYKTNIIVDAAIRACRTLGCR
jgi:hypothetical protein